jgi:hypothetical protein
MSYFSFAGGSACMRSIGSSSVKGEAWKSTETAFL